MSSGDAVPPEEGSRRSGWRLVVGGALVLLVLWAVAAAATAALAYRDLQAARGSFDVAAEQLRDNDLVAAEDTLRDGVELAGSAASSLELPHLAPLRVVPIVAENLETTTILSRAARDAGAASADVLEATIGIVESDRPVVLGRAALDHLDALSPVLRELSDALDRTSDEVRAAPDGQLIGAVERARSRFLEVVDPAVESMQIAADLAEVMPGFLGGSEPRTYLIGAASLSELRASGGLLGSWSLLVAEEGDLRFDEFSPIGDLDPQGAEAAPPSTEFAARYGRFGALREWRNTNLTPDFPTAAQVMLELWETQGGEPLDGVIITDTVTFQRIVERSGPIDVPGLVTLTAENTLDFVGVEAYAAFEDQAERKEVLGGVATSAFERMFDVLSGDDLRATVASFDDLAQGGHLRVYARDQATQSVLRRAGLGGELPDTDGEFAGIYVSNFAANKVDFFTERQIEHRVVLGPDGRTRSTLEVTFANTAPTEGYPRYVLGPWTDVTEVGDNLSFVSLFCGYRCEFDTIPDGAQDEGSELDRPVVDLNLLVPAGAQRTLRYRTITADGWQLDGDEIVVRIHHFVQPTLRGTPLRVVVPLPVDWEPSELPEGATAADGEIFWEDPAASGPVELIVRLVPAGPAATDLDR